MAAITINQCHLWKRNGVEEKLSHSFLLILPQHVYLKFFWLMQRDLVVAGWLLACGGLIGRFPVEIAPFNQEASVCSPWKPGVLFPDSSFLSVIMCQAPVAVIQGFAHCFIRVHFLSLASENPAIIVVIISNMGEILKSHVRWSHTCRCSSLD